MVDPQRLAAIPLRMFGEAVELNALVDWVRGAGIKVVPLCPFAFAKAQFDKDASIRSVLVQAAWGFGLTRCMPGSA
jgi:hypothetical protein